MASSDLSALLASSRNLTSHLSKPELPSVNLSLDQIEAQSRRLVSRLPGTANDSDRANYLLAQARVDATALSSSIANLNAASTFTSLQPLQDTDISGYLRHAHEQNLISTIEEGRRQTQQEFYRMLEDRSRKDWEAKKRRVFEELGGRSGTSNAAISEMTKSIGGKSSALSATPSLSLQMQNKMLTYDQVVSELNTARLRGTSFPIVNSLLNAAASLVTDGQSQQMASNFHILANITGEPPALPPVEHASAHILNAPMLERKFARAYLGDPESRDAIDLRKQITQGSRQALEIQYWDVIERTIQARAQEARLGGDPSVGNKIRAFLMVRHYREGEWKDRIELVASQPMWARLFYLVRTGHAEEALVEAVQHQKAIEHREVSFVDFFRTWIRSPERKLPREYRDRLQSVYNAHMLHSSTVDPFKLALFKLMGKLEPSRRSVPVVTSTTEDWLWFQLSMVNESEEGGLRGLAEVFLNYGPQQFDGAPNQPGSRRGVWAGVLLMCGQFERAVASLWEHQDTEVESIHLAIALAYHGLLRVPSRAETSDITPLSLSPVHPPALSLSSVIWRYVRQFVKMDAKEALQYVCSVCLSADQPQGIGKEQVESAWEQVRRIIVMANSGPGWEELVGGFRPDGTRFSGIIEQNATLLKLEDTQQYNIQIIIRAAKHSEENDRISEAVKLYNLAGDHSTVVSCLAQALGVTISQPSPDESARVIEKTAAEILRQYERTNRAVGKNRNAVVQLLKIREAIDAKNGGRPEMAMDIMESTDLIPLENNMTKNTRKAEEFRDLHESLQRNLPIYLSVMMDCLAAVHQKIKESMVSDAARQMTLASLKTKSRSILTFAGMLKYRMSNDVYDYLFRLDVKISSV